MSGKTRLWLFVSVVAVGCASYERPSGSASVISGPQLASLERTGLEIGDFDLFENNEAFAVNSVLFNQMLSVPLDRLNVHGGAIALGHPIGASGARIVTTLIHALRRRDLEQGLAAICHGTGGGTAMAVACV